MYWFVRSFTDTDSEIVYGPRKCRLKRSIDTICLETYLCTQAQTLFSLYRGLDCRADTMARRDEKFLRMRHSCWDKKGQQRVTRWLARR